MHVSFDNILWKRFVNKFSLPPLSLNYSLSTLKLWKSLEHTTKTLASPDASMHDFFYLPGGASSHTSGVAQQHLHKELGRRFVDKFSWPPSSTNCSPLGYYFLNAVKQEVYIGRRAPFKDLEELKKNIKQVLRGYSEIEMLRWALLQFCPRLKEVIRQKGGAIKQIYG